MLSAPKGFEPEHQPQHEEADYGSHLHQHAVASAGLISVL